MQEQEIWKDIEGYEGRYQVSNKGRVKSLPKTTQSVFNGVICTREYPERILTPIDTKSDTSKGYVRVHIGSGHGKRVLKLIHRLVASAFIPNPNNFRVVNHKDEDKTNNNVNNLEWCTHEYNCAYGTARYRIGKAHINHPKMSKRVAQHNPEGELIRVFPSIREACRKLGINNGNLTEVLKGKRRTCGGYVWKYINYKK